MAVLFSFCALLLAPPIIILPLGTREAMLADAFADAAGLRYQSARTSCENASKTNEAAALPSAVINSTLLHCFCSSSIRMIMTTVDLLQKQTGEENDDERGKGEIHQLIDIDEAMDIVAAAAAAAAASSCTSNKAENAFDSSSIDHRLYSGDDVAEEDNKCTLPLSPMSTYDPPSTHSSLMLGSNNKDSSCSPPVSNSAQNASGVCLRGTNDLTTSADSPAGAATAASSATTTKKGSSPRWSPGDSISSSRGGGGLRSMLRDGLTLSIHRGTHKKKKTRKEKQQELHGGCSSPRIGDHDFDDDTSDLSELTLRTGGAEAAGLGPLADHDGGGSGPSLPTKMIDIWDPNFWDDDDDDDDENDAIQGAGTRKKKKGDETAGTVDETIVLGDFGEGGAEEDIDDSNDDNDDDEYSQESSSVMTFQTLETAGSVNVASQQSSSSRRMLSPLKSTKKRTLKFPSPVRGGGNNSAGNLSYNNSNSTIDVRNAPILEDDEQEKQDASRQPAVVPSPPIAPAVEEEALFAADEEGPLIGTKITTRRKTFPDTNLAANNMSEVLPAGELGSLNRTIIIPTIYRKKKAAASRKKKATVVADRAVPKPVRRNSNDYDNILKNTSRHHRAGESGGREEEGGGGGGRGASFVPPSSPPSTKSKGQKNTKQSNNKKKNAEPTLVSFTTVHVRQYERIMCENPACSSGPSVGIGWRFVENEPVQLKEFEIRRRKNKGPRTPTEFLLSRSKREDMVRHLGYKDREIAAIVRSVNKAKFKRRQTSNNLPAQHVEEAIESAKRQVEKLLFFLDKK